MPGGRFSAKPFPFVSWQAERITCIMIMELSVKTMASALMTRKLKSHGVFRLISRRENRFSLDLGGNY